MPLLPRHNWIVHVLAWLVFGSMPVLFSLQTGHQDFAALWSSPSLYLLLFLFPALYYLHVGWAIPTFLARRNYAAYTLVLVLAMGVVLLLKPYDSLIHEKQQRSAGMESVPPHFGPPPPRDEMGPPPARPAGNRNPSTQRPLLDIISLTMALLTGMAGFAFYNMRRYAAARQAAADAQVQQARWELQFLKAQINPHFLFNTLNNIYSLVQFSPPKASEAILQLSEMMRFVTEEAGNLTVTVDKEVECIEHFLSLQRLRLSAHTQVQWHKPDASAGTACIPPLLLLTFVENAFKYGISNAQPSDILIQLSVSNGRIHFQVSNAVFPHQEKKGGGTGLINARKRLEHIYGDDFVLTINNLPQYFSVTLNLPEKPAS